MRRSIRQACAAVTASAALSALGISGVTTAGAATQVPQPARFTATASKLAVSGARLWVQRYNGPGNGADWATQVAVSPGGNRVFVTGSSAGASSDLDYATAAYSAATGARLWTTRYNGAANGAEYAHSVAVSPGGNRVYVTGTSAGTTTGSDYATIAYSAATGARLWAARYNGAADGSDVAVAVAVSPEGDRVFVTGYSDSASSGDDYATAAYSAATGAQLWTRQYDGGGFDGAAALAVSPDGSRVYVTGSAGDSCDTCGNYGTVAYDAATGAQQWARQYDGGGFDGAAALAVSPDGKRVYVTGSSEGQGGEITTDYATIAYSAVSGTQQWARRYDGPGHSGDTALAVAVSPAGTVLVTGYSSGARSRFDYATIAYKGTGTRLWVKRYNGTGNSNDYARSVAAPGNGKVYVTGDSWGGPVTHYDYVTVAYNIFTGAPVWVRRYSGPAVAPDHATAVAARGGRAFVTGASLRTTSGWDYTTIAYNG